VVSSVLSVTSVDSDVFARWLPMRILYSAVDQTVPGTVGGSVHVTAVAEGLAALGHEVHVLVSPGTGGFPEGPVRWIPMRPPLGRRELRWARTRAVRRLAQTLGSDAIIERYYNFGGEGILAGAALGRTTMLEVNAPVIDHQGSVKQIIDRALIVEPMRRWRERICRTADVIVTPSAAILPRDTPTAKIVVLEWGADTRRFRPGAAGSLPFTRPPGVVAVFAGAFRRWHGAVHLVRAMKQLRARGVNGLSAVLIGDGPELSAVRAEASGLENVLFTSAVAHAVMPACLAAADIGVAPFDTAAHGPLTLGFYWSPLKIFEYMATGLPVVAPALPRIASLAAHDREALLYDPAQPEALADALATLLDAPLRARLGVAARERAEREYSWVAHCDALDAALARVRRR
jgi:glycosyltransferase involved in cell wall biosynthesis